MDLREHKLVYDGTLTMKLGDNRRQKSIELHVVLLEDCIMLLQKQDDKYLLKFHSSAAVTGVGGGSGKSLHSPVIKFSTLLVRPVATGKQSAHHKCPGSILVAFVIFLFISPASTNATAAHSGLVPWEGSFVVIITTFVA